MVYLPHMEPQLPSPNSGPERGPIQPNEQLAPLRAPERAPLPSGGERAESHEQQPSGPSDPVAAQPAPPPLPQLVQSAPAASQPQVTADDTNPALAADEDLIEKEWVEKAKKVIAETKHDPHLQEQAVSRLQADYLQKRYGKVVKLPNDS